MTNVCPKCEICGAQMVEERVYGIGRLCRCPECGNRTNHPYGPLGWAKPPNAVKNAFERKQKEAK